MVEESGLLLLEQRIADFISRQCQQPQLRKQLGRLHENALSLAQGIDIRSALIAKASEEMRKSLEVIAQGAPEYLDKSAVSMCEQNRESMLKEQAELLTESDQLREYLVQIERIEAALKPAEAAWSYP